MRGQKGKGREERRKEERERTYRVQGKGSTLDEIKGIYFVVTGGEAEIQKFMEVCGRLGGRNLKRFVFLYFCIPSEV